MLLKTQEILLNLPVDDPFRYCDSMEEIELDPNIVYHRLKPVSAHILLEDYREKYREECRRNPIISYKSYMIGSGIVIEVKHYDDTVRKHYMYEVRENEMIVKYADCIHCAHNRVCKYQNDFSDMKTKGSELEIHFNKDFDEDMIFTAIIECKMFEERSGQR